MKAAVVVFPGSNCESDCFNVLNDVVKTPVEYVWHKERSFPEVDLVVLPGGFSYGDYLRTGSIARFSPAMEAVKKHVEQGRYVIGICNGFQILLESGILPGAMLQNKTLSFICKHVWLRTDDTNNVFTQKMSQGDLISIPIAHGEGNYYCDDDVLKKLQDNSQIVFRYTSEKGETGEEHNPNGSRDDIAGIINDKRNVLGMMPHPERASEEILSGVDGTKIWESLFS